MYIFATQCRRPLIFQIMNSVRPNNLSLKYQRFTSYDWKDIGIRQFVFLRKTQFLYKKIKPLRLLYYSFSYTIERNRSYLRNGEGEGIFYDKKNPRNRTVRTRKLSNEFLVLVGKVAIRIKKSCGSFLIKIKIFHCFLVLTVVQLYFEKNIIFFKMSQKFFIFQTPSISRGLYRGQKKEVASPYSTRFFSFI